jgi:hypothetical protein
MRSFLGVKAASAPLSDGTTILYFDGDALAVGVAVFTDEAMTTPAPNGDHTLSDGRMITVSAGVITAVTDAVDDSANKDEAAAKLAAAQAELATAQAKIAELTVKAELAVKNETEIVAMKKEVAKIKSDFETQIKNFAVNGGDPLKNTPKTAKAYSEMTATERFKFDHKIGAQYAK